MAIDKIVGSVVSKESFYKDEKNIAANVKVAFNAPNVVGNGGFDLANYHISLEGVFLPMPDANVPYTGIFESWENAFIDYLLLPEKAFMDEMHKAAGEEKADNSPNFLNVSWEDLFNIPITEGGGQASSVSQANSEGGVLSIARVIDTQASDNSFVNSFLSVESVPVAFVSPFESFQSLSILLPTIPFPTLPVPVTPTLNLGVPELPDVTAKTVFLNEIYLNTYQAIQVEGNIFNNNFGFNVGAQPNGGVAALSVSFSASNIAGGTSDPPGVTVLTTAQGNTLTFFTANVTIDGVTYLAGDFILTLSHAILSQPIITTQVTIGSTVTTVYLEDFLYAITNSFGNTSVGQLNFAIVNDKPVALDQTGPEIFEANIPLVGSAGLTTPNVVSGSLVTPITASGVLVVTPSTSSAIAPPADASYFGANGGHVANVTLSSVEGVIGTITATTIFLNNTFFVTDTLGNVLKVNDLTGAWTYTLNAAFHDATPGGDAIITFTYEFIDNTGQTSSATLTLDAKDDLPKTFVVSGTEVFEAGLVMSALQPFNGSEAGSSSFPVASTGNLFSGNTNNATYGADGPASSNPIMFTGTISVSGATFGNGNASENDSSHITTSTLANLESGSTIEASLATELLSNSADKGTDTIVLITDSDGDLIGIDESTGQYALILSSALKNMTAGSSATISVGYTLTDGDGGTSSSNITFGVQDDLPKTFVVSGTEVFEAGLPTGSEAGSSSLPIASTGNLFTGNTNNATYGADGPASSNPITFTGTISVSGATFSNGNASENDSSHITTSTLANLESGSTIEASLATELLSNSTDKGTDTIVLITDSNGDLIGIDESTGQYALILSSALKNITAGSSATISVGYTIADGDGGTSSSNITFGVQDDLPKTFTVSGTEVFEAGLPTGSEAGSSSFPIASTGNLFTGNTNNVTYGADGPASSNPITFTGTISVSGATFSNGSASENDSSHITTSTLANLESGSTIEASLATELLSNSADKGTDTIVLITDSNGDLIGIDESTGQYGLVLNGALNNMTAGGSATISVGYTVSDGDGGTSSSNITFGVQDDLPKAFTVSGTEVFEAGLPTGSQAGVASIASAGNLFTGNTNNATYGADGAASSNPITLTGAVSVSGATFTNGQSSETDSVTTSTIANLTSAGGLEANLATDLLTNSADKSTDTVVLITDSDGDLVGIDESTGQYGLVLNSALSNITTGGSATISVGYTLTDGDGGTSSSNITFGVQDDTPKATPQSPAGPALGQAESGNLFTLTGNSAGADGVGGVQISAQDSGATTQIITNGDGTQTEIITDQNNTLAVNLSTGAYTFTFNSGVASGSEAFNYTLKDSDGGTSSSTITFTGIGVTDPIVLDLSGQGIHLVSADASHVTVNDLTGNGNQQTVGWITSGEGVLMLNSNGNGTLTSINQIDFTSYTSGATNSLQGLMAFDTNHDGKLDVGDKNFNEFGVLLANGTFESLSQLGIVSISLTSNNQHGSSNGNTIYGYSSYQTANGTTYSVADVGFAFGSNNKGSALHTHDILSDKHAPSLDFSKLPSTVSSVPVSGQNSTTSISSSTPSIEHQVTQGQSAHFVAGAMSASDVQHLSAQLQVHHHHVVGHG